VQVLLRQLIGAVQLISTHHIVHADIKPDNILIQQGEGADNKFNMKLIDFGSGFSSRSPKLSSATTPEYCNFMLKW